MAVQKSRVHLNRFRVRKAIRKDDMLSHVSKTFLKHLNEPLRTQLKIVTPQRQMRNLCPVLPTSIARWTRMSCGSLEITVYMKMGDPPQFRCTLKKNTPKPAEDEAHHGISVPPNCCWGHEQFTQTVPPGICCDTPAGSDTGIAGEDVAR